MIIKTWRDVEIELKKLQVQLAAMQALRVKDNNVSISEATVLALINQYAKRNVIIGSGSNINPSDLDIASNGGEIIHQLVHRFLEYTLFSLVYTKGAIAFADFDSLLAEVWLINRTISTQLTVTFVGASEVFLLKFNAAATEAASQILFIGEIGKSTERVEKLWLKDLDISGTVTGAGAATVNSNLSANASSALTLTTSFADIAGCSVSLNVNGVWKIEGCFVFVHDSTDCEAQGTLIYDGSAQTGIVRTDATVTQVATCTKVWFVTVTGQPKTAKLQAKKNSGVGSSAADITNTSITATFLHT